jgi:hypothetical protein
MWFSFHDMNGGGFTKTDYSRIYIQADTIDDAVKNFTQTFNVNPYDTTCDCCGPDFSIDDDKDLVSVTAYDRGCLYDDNIKSYVDQPDTRYSFKKYLTIDDYVKKDDICVIYK